MPQINFSLHFVDVIFGVSSIDDSVWADHAGSKSGVLQLILSACHSSEMIFGVSLKSSFASLQIVAEAPEHDPSLKPKFIRSTCVLGIVRGRDAPFPVRPCPDRRVTILGPSSKALLERRYSSPSQSPIIAGPSGSLSDVRGQVLPQPESQRMGKPPSRRPRLTRSGPKLVYSAPENVSQDEETEDKENEEMYYTTPRQSSWNSTLLRIPPFPLPHRALQQCPTTNNTDATGSAKIGLRKERLRLTSKRVSSVPPPLLLLDNIYFRDRQQEVMFTEDSPVLGREEVKRLSQLQQRHLQTETVQCSPTVALCA